MNSEFKNPIAVFLPKGFSTIVSDLGILYSGNFYTNLDVKSPPQRVKNIIDNISPLLVVTSKEWIPTLESIGVESDKILLVENIENDGGYDQVKIDSRLSSIIDTDPACIINTSGSTGIPKSVVMNHRSIIDFMDWFFSRLGVNQDERIGSLSPFYFDIYTLELWYCLAKGATIVIIPESLAIFPAKLVEYLEEKGITFIFWVPTIMVNIANLDLLSRIKLTKLNRILFAGEVFPMKHLNYWRHHLPDAAFVNLYGPIEITVDCTYFVIEREYSDDEPLPIGFPCKNTDILILNEDNKITATDEYGELCVRGTSLAMGYWNDTEKTAKAFIQNPLNTHYPELIYRTGDIVYKNKFNEIIFVGRKDFQIKHQGYRIELGEIEHILLNRIGALDNVCILYNRMKKEITMFYESEAEITPVLIRQKLGEILPKYMLPTVFNKLESMPKNANGKIDRQKLQEQLN